MSIPTISAAGANQQAAPTADPTRKPRRNRRSAKTAGTRAETAIANHLRDAGFIHAERRARTGAKDTGDISGLIGGVIEVKDCATTNLAGWLAEAGLDDIQDGAA
jgi:hypothetical protein